MKVLLVSHTCMSRTAGQPKAHCLAAFPDVDLTVLVPDKMCTYGTWKNAEVPENAAFRFVVGRARWQYIAKQWYLLHYPDAVKNILREFQPDIVDIWEEPWSLTCAQAVYLTRKLCPKARIVVETEQNIYKKLPPPFQQLQSYSLKHADFLVGRNQEALEVARRKGYSGPLRCVPNAVDCTLFQPRPEAERAILRAKAGWGAASDFRVGYVGRLVPEKGLADAVEAFAKLPADSRLIFVGDGPMRPELEAQAQTLGLAERVVFAGPKPLTELPNVMNTLDVLVLPSRTTSRWKEQFGRVLIEAGACGMAVVGSDSGAIPEVIADAGLVFPEGDTAAFGQCLRRLKDDLAFRQQCGANGHRRANDLFSWQQVAASMRDIYCEVLSSAGR